jgi:hypothetical protein
MRQIAVRYRLILACTLTVAICGQPAPAAACSAMAISNPRDLVERATAIVHVKVRGVCTESTESCAQLGQPPPSPPPPPPPEGKPFAPGWPPVAPLTRPSSNTSFAPGSHYGLIALDVVETLKGEAIPTTFAIRGRLVEQDDFNDRPAPYDFVRRGGRSGNCFAYGYREGAEYLLFLRETNHVMAPYWAALAPVNEQVRSKDDPWIQWVRRQLAGE